MTRISSLLVAVSLAVMPVASFAQQNATTTDKPAVSQPVKTDAKSPVVHTAKVEAAPKTTVAPKVTKDTAHAKATTPAPATKTAEPNKS